MTISLGESLLIQRGRSQVEEHHGNFWLREIKNFWKFSWLSFDSTLVCSKRAMGDKHHENAAQYVTYYKWIVLFDLWNGSIGHYVTQREFTNW